jgi:hypothetical protein
VNYQSENPDNGIGFIKVNQNSGKKQPKNFNPAKISQIRENRLLISERGQAIP